MTGTVVDMGREPLHKPHYELFAQNVASGMQMGDAYAAAIGKALTPGRRVSATKIHARTAVLDRIAYLRRTNAATGAPERLTGSHLSELMETVTKALTRAAEVAACTGASYAQQSAIRKGLVMHAGRTTRLEAKAPPIEKCDEVWPANDFHFCTCETTP
jgi:hypothetical protein